MAPSIEGPDVLRTQPLFPNCWTCSADTHTFMSQNNSLFFSDYQDPEQQIYFQCQTDTAQESVRPGLSGTGADLQPQQTAVKNLVSATN